MGVQGPNLATGTIEDLKACAAAEEGRSMPMDQRVTGRNALIGRIDEGDPFIVNLEFDDTVQVTGTVYLRMNDCDHWLYDNDGSVVVSIQVVR